MTVDGFGAYRRGHVHSGLDLEGAFSELVYPIGRGTVVCFVYAFPNRGVVVRHELEKGRILYSSYVHLADITVDIGDSVDETTPIGRIFNRSELRKSGFRRQHLHLEIRKNLDDHAGRASYLTKKRAELSAHFIDPWIFFTQHLK